MARTAQRRGTPHQAGFETESESLDAIHRAIERQPVEDGDSHPAEELVADHIERFDGGGLVEHALSGDGSTHAPELIRLMGRTPEIAPDLRRLIVGRGLASGDLAVRDASIQAVETWEDPSLIALIRAHRDPVGWLAEYAEMVVRDLGV